MDVVDINPIELEKNIKKDIKIVKELLKIKNSKNEDDMLSILNKLDPDGLNSEGNTTIERIKKYIHHIEFYMSNDIVLLENYYKKEKENKICTKYYVRQWGGSCWIHASFNFFFTVCNEFKLEIPPFLSQWYTEFNTENLSHRFNWSLNQSEEHSPTYLRKNSTTRLPKELGFGDKNCYSGGCNIKLTKSLFKQIQLDVRFSNFRIGKIFNFFNLYMVSEFIKDPMFFLVLETNEKRENGYFKSHIAYVNTCDGNKYIYNSHGKYPKLLKNIWNDREFGLTKTFGLNRIVFSKDSFAKIAIHYGDIEEFYIKYGILTRGNIQDAKRLQSLSKPLRFNKV